MGTKYPYYVVLQIVLCGALLSGCATVVRGTTEPLFLNSTPHGATAKLSTGHSCMTPCQVVMDRDASFTVTFSRDGCQEEQVSVFPTLAGGGVLLGGIVDYGTGAVYSLKPNPAVATLSCPDVPAALPAAQVDTSSPPEARLQRLNELRDKGLLSQEEYDRKRAEILQDL